jgi:glycosyltransferase involved in cell wall biosynthesis
MAQADCGLFPSKAEGWNLPLAEMLAAGKHCIATDYSAHTEFATEENCRLIKIDRLEPAFDGRWFFGQGNWAHFGDDQLDQLIFHMQEVHKAKQEGRLGVNQAGIESMKVFSWENTVKEILEAV